MKKYKLFTTSLVVITLLIVIMLGCKKTIEQDKLLSKEERALANSSANPLAGSKAFCETSIEASVQASGKNSNIGFKVVSESKKYYYTDYVSAGVGGMRNVGTGTIALSGVSGTVTKAYLYWHGISNLTTDVGNSITVGINAYPVTGTNIGISSDNCWGYLNSQAYRADVTSLVQATGNGNYDLSGFGNLNPNGASLIVFFNDGDYTNNRDVVLFDGNDSNIPFPGIGGNPNAPADPSGWDVLLSGINYTSGIANIQLHVADGQTFSDGALVMNALPFVAAGAIFQGTSVPGANNGPDNNGNLWDIRTFAVTSFLSPGPNSLHLTSILGDDCLGLIVAIIDLPTGSAPGFPYCGENGDKVQVCHKPGTAAQKTLCLEFSNITLGDHLSHGDKIGPCN